MAGTFKTLQGEVVVVMNPVAVKELLSSTEGPVMRYLFTLGERVKIAAIAMAPKKTGNLAAHIVKRFVLLGDQSVVLVGIDGTQVPYAYWVHEGAPPHLIYPSRAPRLVFFSQKLGKTIYMPIGAPVHHPGNKPNRFLLRALASTRV